MFSLISAWINGWVNNREAGDLRRPLSHYDVSVMNSLWSGATLIINNVFSPYYSFWLLKSPFEISKEVISWNPLWKPFIEILGEEVRFSPWFSFDEQYGDYHNMTRDVLNIITVLVVVCLSCSKRNPSHNNITSDCTSGCWKEHVCKSCFLSRSAHLP